MDGALQAMLQQTDVRIADLKTEAFEFKKHVVQAGEHHLTGARTRWRLVGKVPHSFMSLPCRAAGMTGGVVTSCNRAHSQNRLHRAHLVLA